jgi:hypothetical protein
MSKLSDSAIARLSRAAAAGNETAVLAECHVVQENAEQRVEPYGEARAQVVEMSHAGLSPDALLCLNEALLLCGVYCPPLFEAAREAADSDEISRPEAVRAAAWILFRTKQWDRLHALGRREDLITAVGERSSRGAAELADLSLFGFYRRFRYMFGLPKRAWPVETLERALRAELRKPVYRADETHRALRDALGAYFLGDSGMIERIGTLVDGPPRLSGDLSGLECSLSDRMVNEVSYRASRVAREVVPWHMVQQSPARRVVLFSVDAAYLEAFGARFIASVLDAGFGVHVHAIDHDPDSFLRAAFPEQSATFGVSLQRTPLADASIDFAKGVCAGGRFLVAPTLLDRHEQVVISDVDGVMVEPAPDFHPEGADVGLRFLGNAVTPAPVTLPWDFIAAGLVSLRASSAAYDFAQDVRRYMEAALLGAVTQSRRFFPADQCALWFAAGRQRKAAILFRVDRLFVQSQEWAAMDALDVKRDFQKTMRP